jgi:hypothetical protein
MIAPTFAAIAGVLLVALFPTRDERAAFRRRRARHLVAYYRAPWSRALEPGGALVAPFTIGREPMTSECSLSDTATAHEGDLSR